MACTTCLQLSLFAALCTLSTPNPSPQFYPFPFQGPQPFNPPPDQQFSGSEPWQQTLRNNFNFTRPNYRPNPNPNPNYLDPLSSPAAEEILKNDIPRQVYGVPPPPSSGYPQIYKLDNLIIIANPPQPQPCIQRPPPAFPNPKPTGGSEDGVDNRFGEEPTRCTWAIVACCSPDNANVRYNCFELLGCPGFFFDNSPCDPKTVMAAANAALEFYRNSGNSSSVDANKV